MSTNPETSSSLKAWRACEEHFQREFREKLLARLCAFRGPILAQYQHDLLAKEITSFHLSWSDEKAMQAINSHEHDE